MRYRKIGMIGLGAMGSGMASCLLKEGYEVCAFDIDAQAGAKIREIGAVTVSSCREVGEQSEVVVTVLPNEKVVEAATFGENGLAVGMKPGQILIECSTINVRSAQDIARRLGQSSIVMLDAPVSGGPEGAAAGTLSFMVGGDEKAFEACTGLFSCMGREIVYMGVSGTGQLTKLVNQLLYDINAAALAEVLPFGIKLGLEPEKIARIVNSGAGRSFASEYFMKDYLAGDFTHGYNMGSAYKDLVNAADLSYRHNIPMPVTTAACVTYQQALAKGYGCESKASMIKIFEEINGVRFRSASKPA